MPIMVPHKIEKSNRPIELFKEKTECCACTACMFICPQKAIAMYEDEEGFLYPNIDISKCIQCGMCLTVCAFKRAK